MITVYELYDLHEVLIGIRSYPNDPLNKEIVLNLLTVIDRRFEYHDLNQIRKALQSIKGITKKNFYSFVFTENCYTYFPLPFLKDERIYAILRSCLEEIIVSFNEKNYERVSDLADCLHNIPIIIAENHYTIPRKTWKFIKCYRNKWNNAFLQTEQENMKNSLNTKWRCF